MRSMTNVFHGRTFYESTFDPENGNLVRQIVTPAGSHTKESRYRQPSVVDLLFSDEEIWEAARGTDHHNPIGREWDEMYGWHRREPFSPSPETLDIKITDWCGAAVDGASTGFGCPYCYMDSKATSPHAPTGHVEKVIESFGHRPYQVALGGGEPCSHPDFAEILQGTREMGVVPNYTTAGHIWRDEVIEATRECVGGVSLTYHPHKGEEWFAETFEKWREALRHDQLHVQLVAKEGVDEHLRFLADLPGLESVILLGYYSDTGRASGGAMTKDTYHRKLPEAIRYAQEGGAEGIFGVDISFSEALLPYFLSRPGLVDTSWATAQEGLFSAYVDDKGYISHSSFSPPQPGEDAPYRFSGEYEGPGLQEDWNRMAKIDVEGKSCESCPHRYRCARPDIEHYLQCAFADHNRD